MTIFLTILILWALIGVGAWIYLMWAVNRRYKTPIFSRGTLIVLAAFILLGALAWFPACVIKAINEIS